MNKEILLVVDSVSNEKDMDKEIIFNAIESALATVTAKQYNEEVDIRVSIDRKTGDYITFRKWLVIENTDDPSSVPGTQISLKQAQYVNTDVCIGDIVEEKIQSIEFGRIGAQMAKQVIMREIRKAERAEIIKHYANLIGILLMGTVKKIMRDKILLDISNGVEAIILRDGLLPKDNIRIHDRIRGILSEVKDDPKGPALIITRTSNKMLLELFKIEVPEIAECIINIKAIARDPGLRSKIVVKTNDGRIDPIGACIGIRGSRVQNVSNELCGERIDVILWDDDPAQLVVNAMAPAEVTSIVVDEEKKIMEIAVRDDQLALAIGRNGQNVKLASELSEWKLNVISISEAENKTKTEAENLESIFIDNLAVDKELANILIQEGFKTLEDIAHTPIEELISIDGFNKDMADILHTRAHDALLKQALSSTQEIGSVQPAQDLLDIRGMSRHLAYILASKGIVSREDLADQSIDELSDIEELDQDKAGKLIMEARGHWFNKNN